MTVTDDPEHRVKGALDRLERADIDDRDRDKIKEFLDAIHPDKNTVNYTDENGQRETKSYGTVASYCQSLKRIGELSNKPIVEFETVAEVNQLFDEFQTGEHPNVKDSGYGESTMGQWQSAITKFYHYHSEFGIDPAKIVINAPPDSKVDDRDMYSRDEIEAMREAVMNTRDRCILELLLNTGQRIRAIQTLRIKDVDTEKGIYYLNTEDRGLKGADKNGTKRPLLGAKRAVYDWLKNHPTGEPEDYLITSLSSAGRGNPGEKLSQSNIRRRLKIIAENAGVDKPPNPHNFRHYFVTVCKRDYDMDDSTIKHLIGHGQGSNIMETTYQHLNDDDHIQAAEAAAGIREEKDESPLTPNACPTCSEQLEPHYKSCPACGTVFSPDVEAAKDEIKEDISQDESDAEDQEEALDQLRQLIEEKPELLNELAD